MGQNEREERAKIFEYTSHLYKTNDRLIKSIKNSRAGQALILETDKIISNKQSAEPKSGKVIVSDKRSFEAASEYARRGIRTAVHNFASATRPGGGVLTGAGAQEECLCRCSTLYPCIDIKEMWNGFYTPHRNSHNPLHNGDIIYTPDVTVFMTDTDFPKRMDESDWYSVDVITCAAPNLREKPSNRYNPNDGDGKISITNKELEDIHTSRLRRILQTAYANGCEAVILGAFGCGAFKNPPEVVARASKIVAEEFKNRFEVIEFAVYCRCEDDRNYRAFRNALM